MRPMTQRLFSVCVLIFIVSVVGLVLALIFQWPAQLGGGSGNPNITAGADQRIDRSHRRRGGRRRRRPLPWTMGEKVALVLSLALIVAGVVLAVVLFVL